MDSTLPSEAPCVVIGTGVLGSSAAAALADRLGDDVLVLEQFEPGHRRGSSQDHSRIIRHSYASATYTRLTPAMFAAWAQVERDADARLVVRTGGLDLADPAVPGGVDIKRPAIPHRRSASRPFAAYTST